MGEPVESRLPPELEREIFLCALNNSFKNAKDLLLVWRSGYTIGTLEYLRNPARGNTHNGLIVRLTPAIYEVVALHSGYSTPFPFDKEDKEVYERYGKHTRHLMVEVDDVVPYLSFFPNVTDLALWTLFDPSLGTYLENLPLTRLSFRLNKFDPPTPRLIQTFSRITHLEMVGLLNSWSDCHLLDHFTSLSHLCLLWDTNEEILNEMLRRYNLKVIILWDWNTTGDVDSSAELSPLGNRGFSHFSVIPLRYDFIKDWEIGARGGRDIWKFADEILEMRRREILSS